MPGKPKAARGKTTKKEGIKRQINKLRDQFGKLPKAKKMSPGENLARFGSVTGPKSTTRRPGLRNLRKAMADAGAGTAGAGLRRAAAQLKKASKGMKRGGKAK